MLLSIHMAAGGLAIALGAAALLAKKGGTIHRRSGLLFVCAMLVLGTTAALLGFRKSPTDGNVFGGLMTVYFVVTALMTVRPASSWTRRGLVAALIVAAGLALVDIAGGVKAFSSPRGSLNGVPFAMHFFLAGVMILAAAGDVRILRFGVPGGGRRLARHLWRMCFALFIAAGSFFSIRERVAKILPEPFTTAPMRALPILLVFAAMFYWLWRLRSRRTLLVADDLIALARRWLACFDTHDVEALVALYHADARHTSPKLRASRPETGGFLTGREALRGWWADAFHRIPGLRYRELTLTAGQGRVFMEYVRLAPGEPDLPVAEVLEVEGGLIRASRVYHG